MLARCVFALDDGTCLTIWVSGFSRDGLVVMIDKTRYLDLDCVRLANSTVSFLVTQSVGPRIISLSLHGQENLFAQLPDIKLECPGSGFLTLWGGHRLWHAPEVRRRTYLPDDQPVEILAIENGLQVIQPPEESTGIQKSLRIFLPDDSATVIVDHALTNRGLWPVTCAPWAITQLKPGGVAILPQPTALSDPDGLTPNRQIALWPYTEINNPHITWGDRFIFIKATMTGGALKLGFPNPSGWLAYHYGQTLFVKKAAFRPDSEYLDQGSSSQCYCNPHFLELETLGPRTTIAPDESVTHREVWEVYANITLPHSEDEAQTLSEEKALSQGSTYLEL
jgi:hypothetical protein